MATTAVCNSWKVEVMSGAHAMLPTQTLSCSANSTATVTGLASTAGIAVGMAVTGTNVPANTFVLNIVSATSVTLNQATTGTCSSMTFTGDVLNMLLIKTSPARTFDGTQTNVGTPGSGTPGTANVGTDETSGTGYTSGGAQAVVSASYPQLSSATAVITFGTISWSGATFSCTAGILYNAATRLGAAATPIGGRTIAVYDFGGTQSVSSGTFSLIMPTANSSSAILRIS